MFEQFVGDSLENVRSDGGVSTQRVQLPEHPGMVGWLVSVGNIQL